MASSHIVEVCTVSAKEPMANADKLEVLAIKGWRVVAQKDLVNVGDRVIYLPPDSIITEAYADQLGIAKYCSPLSKRADGTREPGYRIRACRLRGEPSYGTIDHEVPADWEVGKDVAEILGVRKWEPPVRVGGSTNLGIQGDQCIANPYFFKYTDIENINNFPDVLKEGEEVICTEKIHGCNWRAGLVCEADPNTGVLESIFIAGTHHTQRKEFATNGNTTSFWLPLDGSMRRFLKFVQKLYSKPTMLANVIIFGEMFNTQTGFWYGATNGECPVSLFDISVNGKYLDYDRFMWLCNYNHIATVPLIYRGPFSQELLRQHTHGPTTMCDKLAAGKFAGREGVVVRPTTERVYGYKRAIFKSISVDYLDYKTGKGKNDEEVSDA